MKYSLRSLMIVVTLTCVVLGGRIAYLRRMASFHQQERVRYAKMLGLPENDAEDIRTLIGFVSNTNSAGIWNEYRRHGDLEQDYRNAAYRPWTLVNDWSSP